MERPIIEEKIPDDRTLETFAGVIERRKDQ